ncbi:MAG: MBL fold metallo-hydrolase [Paraclostridium sp.]
MKLTQIKGNTYYIRGGTNTGVYVFDNKDALIIDPGLPGFRVKSMIKLFREKEINLKWIINTHEHNDHYGAGYQLKDEYKQIISMSTKQSRIYIENPELFSNYILGGDSNRFMDEKLNNRNIGNVTIDREIEEGILNINNENIDIIDLKGHTQGSIGVYTKDKVLFVGDALIGSEILNKFDLLFLLDIKEYINTLNKLKVLDFECLVLGHGKEILNRYDAMKCIDKHEQIVCKYLYQINNLLKKYSSIEDILKSIINNNKLSCNYKEYHFFKSTTISMLSYLINLNEVDYIISNGELLYYTKEV